MQGVENGDSNWDSNHKPTSKESRKCSDFEIVRRNFGKLCVLLASRSSLISFLLLPLEFRPIWKAHEWRLVPTGIPLWTFLKVLGAKRSYKPNGNSIATAAVPLWSISQILAPKVIKNILIQNF